MLVTEMLNEGLLLTDEKISVSATKSNKLSWDSVGILVRYLDIAVQLSVKLVNLCKKQNIFFHVKMHLSMKIKTIYKFPYWKENRSFE